MNPINWAIIKLKLTNKNKAYEWVLSDLETLEEMAKKLAGKIPLYAAIPDDLYLQNIAIHILVISQFEHLLKSLEKIKKQSGIKNIIKESKILNSREKEYLIVFYLIRNTLVHKGGHFDKDFKDAIKREIKELKVEIPKDSHFRTPFQPVEVIRCIKLIKKIILLDIAKDILSEEEKKIIEASLK